MPQKLPGKAKRREKFTSPPSMGIAPLCFEVEVIRPIGNSLRFVYNC